MKSKLRSLSEMFRSVGEVMGFIQQMWPHKSHKYTVSARVGQVSWKAWRGRDTGPA